MYIGQGEVENEKLEVRKMYKYWISVFLFLFTWGLHAQDTDFYKDYRVRWLEKAEANTPQLVFTQKAPLQTVKIVPDQQAFQGWKVEPASKENILSFYGNSFRDQTEIILDFGEHVTGYFSFSLAPIGTVADAPVRLKFTFGETPSEIMTPFDPFPGGLSRAWMQDETVTVMTLPSTTTIPRRVSFRYVKIELTAKPSYAFGFTSMYCNAGTSAATAVAPLPSGVDPMIRKIDETSLNTLKECMQTVFEDGPKRDQRLWIGDLYLQAMANYYSFKQIELTKRCLYLLAGLSHPNGYLHPCVYETPEPHGDSRLFLLEYALLYNVTLKDYLEATGDKETAGDLWVVAKKQLDIIHTYLQPDGLMDFKKANKEWWIHIDWKDNLYKEVSLHGVSVFALKNTYELAKLLGKEQEVSELPALIEKMTKAAYRRYYDKKTGFFTGLENKQISYASQIWMVLSGIASKKDARRALQNLSRSENVTTPGSPYLYHYYIQALIDAGLQKEAKEILTSYWGGMIKKGADTFWEVYDPGNDYLSPYNFHPLNSYCHAWSCTPLYFIRRYPEIFQH